MYGRVTAEGREMNGETVSDTWARSGWGPVQFLVSADHRTSNENVLTV